MHREKMQRITLIGENKIQYEINQVILYGFGAKNLARFFHVI